MIGYMKELIDGLLTAEYNAFTTFGLKILLAILIIIISKFVIKYINKMIKKIFEKRHVDAAVGSFVASLSNAVLWVIVLIIALSHLGVQTTSFIAVLGAAGLAVGLALQGSLSNFAAGFLIILFRPFKVGDLVEISSILGIVKSISLFNTEMASLDNKKIIIPNSQVMNNVITNITAEDFRRVDFLFRTALNSDLQQVKHLISDVILKHELIIKDDPTKPIFIRMTCINRDSLDFTARAWVLTQDYWQVYFDITEQIKIEFDNNNIIIPLPQMEVRNKQGG